MGTVRKIKNPFLESVWEVFMMDSEKQFLLVHENDSGERLDKYISGQFPSFARSYIQKLLKDGKITVSQKAVKASYKIKTGDEISITIPPAVDPEILPEDIPLDILYEDSEFLFKTNKFILAKKRSSSKIL